MTRLIVLGFDGMDSEVCLKYQDELPNLTAIRNAGGFQGLPSVFPPDSIPAWVTIYTGEYPEEHGWLDNIDYEDLRKTTGSHRLCNLQGKTFWDHIGQAGKRVCVINPLLAYPVWPVNGVMINGPVFISGKKQTYPADLASPGTLPEMGGMTDFPEENELQQFLADTLQSTNNLAEFGLQYLQKEPWDLFFLCFFTLDRLQHFYWRFQDPSDPYYPGPSNLDGAILQAYRVYDTIVGKFMQCAGSDCGMLILSDHGHGQRPIMLANLNELLRQADILKVPPDASSVFSWKKPLEKIKNTAIQVVGKHLGEKWLYRIGRLLPGRARKALKKSTYLVDRDASAAWVSDLGGGAAVGGITIHSRYDRTSAEYCHLTERIVKELTALRDEKYGQVIRWSKVQIEQNYYPDIIFELEPHFSVGRSIFCPLVQANHRHRIISGGHKKEGVLFSFHTGNLDQSIHSLHDVARAITGFVLGEMPITDVSN